MATQRDGIFVWITWLAKVMAGEQACEWASWFKAHYANYEKAPSDFDTAKWKIEHTRKLRELRIERQKLGERVFLEGENEIRYMSPSGVVLAGRPDLIAVNDRGPTIYDVKTGQQKASNEIQVLLYPLCPIWLIEAGRVCLAVKSGCVEGSLTQSLSSAPAGTSGVADQFDPSSPCSQVNRCHPTACRKLYTT